MKKFIMTFTCSMAMVMSSSTLAWEFTEMSVVNRSFEIKSDYDAVFLVDKVRCTATDGKDSLYVDGYFSPTGRWNQGRTISGKHIRSGLKGIEPNLLSAYMEFCARVSRY